MPPRRRQNTASSNWAPQLQLEEAFTPVAHPKQTDRNFITVLARGLSVLRAFRAHGGPMGNKELAELTGIPKATITRITHTLCQLGYLTQDKNRGKYRLSVAVLTLAYPVLSQSRIRQLAHDRLTELAKITGCTIALAAANTDRVSMVYLDVFNDNAANRLRMDIGIRADMARSALGRAFLAGLDEGERQVYYEHLEAANGNNWPALRERIETAIEQVDNRGFCLVDGEWLRNTIGVGAVLRAGESGEVMAVNCGAPSFAISAEKMTSEIGPRLVHLVGQLENMIGL